MRINALGNTATDFANDDYIALDGTTNGSRKMPKNVLLEKTAHNALADKVAQAFDPTRTSVNPYKPGDIVEYNGKSRVFYVEHYGPMAVGVSDQVPVGNYLSDRANFYSYKTSYSKTGLDVNGPLVDYKIYFKKGDRLLHSLSITGIADIKVYLIKTLSPLVYISINAHQDYTFTEDGYTILRLYTISHSGSYDVDFEFNLLNENVAGLKGNVDTNASNISALNSSLNNNLSYSDSYTGANHYFYNAFKKDGVCRIKLTGVTNNCAVYAFKQDDTYDTLFTASADVDTTIILNSDYKSIRYFSSPSIPTMSCLIESGIYKNFEYYNGKISSIETAISKLPVVQEQDLKMCLPKKLYVVKGLPYNIYASSIMLDDFKNVDIFTQSRTTSNFGADLLQIGKVCKIENLKDCSLRIGFEDFVKRNTGLVYKDLSVDYNDVQSVISKNVIVLGDSITNRGSGYFAKKAAESINCSITGFGTMSNYGSFYGEGREGWTFADFIGKSNVCGAGVITPMGSGISGTLTTNPFIRVATAEDLANYPDFCFSNTGVNSEKSYSDDPSLGTYYIFDFGYYLNRFNDLPTIDVVTIALGTNDVFQNYQLTDIIAYAGFMIQRIKSALPSSKIALIPSPAWGATYNNFASKVVPYIEAAKTLADSLSVDVVGLWCFLSRFHSFGLDTSDIDVINPSTNYAPYNENIHYDSGDGGKFAYIEYGKILASYILQ